MLPLSRLCFFQAPARAPTHAPLQPRSDRPPSHHLHARVLQLLASNGYLHTVITHGVYAGLSQDNAAAAAAEFLAAAVVCADDSFPAG